MSDRMLSVFAVVAFGIYSFVGCANNDVDAVSDGGPKPMCIPAINLDCESNWSEWGGAYEGGVLYQATTVTVLIPEGYDGYDYMWGLNAAFTSDPSIPMKKTPELMGEPIRRNDAGTFIPGQTFTFETTTYSKFITAPDIVCGVCYYLDVSFYEYLGPGEVISRTRVAISDVQYEVGGDEIVIDLGELTLQR
jgi:hypothetical protein